MKVKGVIFGGPNARKTGTFPKPPHTPILGYALQYVRDEPSLVIWKLGTGNSYLALKNHGACVIGLSRLHAYRFDRTEDVRANGGNFLRAATAIGLSPLTDRNGLKALKDCVEYNTNELGQMKPMPGLVQKPAEEPVELDLSDGNIQIRINE